MTMPAPGQESLREVEKIIETGYDVAHAWLAMGQAWVRMFLRPPFGGYSVAAEAAELLRQRQGDGGPAAQRPVGPAQEG